MKKKAVAVLLCAALAVSVSACGSTNENTEAGTQTENAGSSENTEETVSSLDMDIDPEACVVSLADYSNIQVSLTGDYEVTDEAVADIINSLLTNAGIDSREVTDRTTVQDGDIVNVDYTGYQDGEAFEGGSATDQMVEISDDNGYIPGFTDGLIGAEVGTTIECPVTFPEDYGVETLNGQEVIFEFVIHGIYEPVTADTVSDEAVAENFSEYYDVNTRDELVNYVQDYLRSQMISNYIEDYMIDNSTVNVPEDYLEARLNEYQAAYAASYYGDEATMESYMSMYGTSLEDVREVWRENLEATIKLELIFQVVAIQEDIQIDEDGFAEYVKAITDNNSYGLTDEQAVYESFGNGDSEKGKDYVNQMYLMNEALTYTIDNATIEEE